MTHPMTPEIEALIESGDIKLADERAKFKRVTGEDMTLDDAGLIQALAATDDDDEDLFVANVRKLQNPEQVAAPEVA